jgi:hypothetical protein
VLEIVQGGGYKFKPTRVLDGAEIPHLELPDTQRIVKEDASIQTVTQAIKDGTGLVDDGKQLAVDVLAAKATISISINTLENISKMDVTNIHTVTRTVTGTPKDASRAIGRLISDVQEIGGLLGADPDLHLPELSGLPKAVDEVKHVFGSALEQVQETISFLENLKFLLHLKVSMTDE